MTAYEVYGLTKQGKVVHVGVTTREKLSDTAKEVKRISKREIPHDDWCTLSVFKTRREADKYARNFTQYW